MFNTKRLESALHGYLIEDFVNIREYQDKYFFIKKIREFFPSINEDILYKALENTNNSYRVPIKKKLFIDKFAKEINKMTV